MCLLMRIVTIQTAMSEHPIHCSVIINNHFQNCVNSNATETDEIHNNNHHHHNNNNAYDKPTCVNKRICHKVFTASRFQYQTFSNKIHDIVTSMVDRCCGKCSKLSVVRNVTDVSQLSSYYGNDTDADFVYPVFGESSIKELYNYKFIPIFRFQSAYYFSLRNSNQQMLEKLINACFNMWPLITISLLMALIAGFIIWAMETRANAEDFSPCFHTGLYEGFWWSIVSMTTVGYGDKAPKSPPGRLFAVIWIFIGITVCSIFTANLTTEIINARLPTDAHVAGKTVGVLKDRLGDATMVVRNGGIIHEIDYTETIQGVIELIDKLHNKDIQGFLFNKDTYEYFYESLAKKKYRKIREKIRGMNIVKTEKFFRGETFSFGMLVNNVTVYQYFAKYFDNNRLQLQACNSVHSNYKNGEFHMYESFSSDSDLFYSFLYYSLGILGVIACFGVIYEMRRRYFAPISQEI